MNNRRRELLRRLYEELAEAQTRLDEIRSEEEEALGDIPDNFAEREAYENAEAAIEALGSASTSLEDALDCIEEAMV